MDMERYGDYNEYEDDIPKSKSPVLRVIKILIIFVCLAVAGVLLFRVLFFNYYPKSIKGLYFNEALTQHYNENGGNIEVKTQKVRFKYDDNKVATFICDNLYVIEGANQLQFSIRYNESAMEYLEEKLSLSGLDSSDPELFTYKLAAYDDELGKIAHLDASVTPVAYESKLMSHSYKLVCDGVELGGQNNPSWIRVDVFIKGVEEKFSSVLIYENHDDYSTFENYELKSEDVPR